MQKKHNLQNSQLRKPYNKDTLLTSLCESMKQWSLIYVYVCVRVFVCYHTFDMIHIQVLLVSAVTLRIRLYTTII